MRRAFARRALHDSFKIFWGQLEGPPVEIRTEDPRAWSLHPKRASEPVSRTSAFMTLDAERCARSKGQG